LFLFILALKINGAIEELNRQNWAKAAPAYKAN
jgi:hypothetical protein